MRKNNPTIQDLQKEIAENTAAILRIQKAAAEAAAEARAEAAAAAKARAEEADKRAKEAEARAAERAAEHAKRMAEADAAAKARAAEHAKRMAEADAAAKARAEEAEAAAKVRAAELAEEMAASKKRMTLVEERMKVITGESGDRGNARGFAFEREVFFTLKAAKELCGIALDGGVKFDIYDDNGFQYDMVALNGKKTIVVETKITLDIEDVNHFAEKRLPFFAEGAPEYADGKEILGAMIYHRTDIGGKAVKAALARGLLVVSVDNNKHLHQITKASDIIERKRRPRKK